MKPRDLFIALGNLVMTNSDTIAKMFDTIATKTIPDPVCVYCLDRRSKTLMQLAVNQVHTVGLLSMICHVIAQALYMLSMSVEYMNIVVRKTETHGNIDKIKQVFDQRKEIIDHRAYFLNMLETKMKCIIYHANELTNTLNVYNGEPQAHDVRSEVRDLSQCDIDQIWKIATELENDMKSNNVWMRLLFPDLYRINEYQRKLIAQHSIQLTKEEDDNMIDHHHHQVKCLESRQDDISKASKNDFHEALREMIMENLDQIQ